MRNPTKCQSQTEMNSLSASTKWEAVILYFKICTQSHKYFPAGVVVYPLVSPPR